MSSYSWQFRFRLSKNGRVYLFFVGNTAGLVVLSFVAAINASDATARVATESTQQTINRTQKADRLLPLHTYFIKQAREFRLPALMAVHAKLPEGCDPLVSPIADDRLANIAGRCVGQS